jgi:DNA-binding transcriptional MerR regulator
MKINELEDLLGVSKATIRYYEDQGLVIPPRTDNGYREYSDEEVQLFQKIIVLRKLGLGIPEIRDLIDGKAELHDVLEYNMERLRTRQDEIASAMELCGKIEAEAADFASIDSPKYLKHIYENEQKGAHFAETKEISVRQLNLAITLLGMLAGAPVIQNKQFSEHSNDKPLPADIRANKKEGDEYATIGTVLKKGGKLKVVFIAVMLIYLALGIWNGYTVWGGLGSGIKYVVDFNRSGIKMIEPDDKLLAQIAEADPEVNDADKMSGLFKFHTKKGMTVTLKGPGQEEWTEIDSKEINAKDGYLFITGDPSSELYVHVVSAGKSIKYSAEIGDSAHKESGTDPVVNSYQEPLGKERAIVLFYRADNPWTGVGDYDLFNKVLKKAPPDGCYAVTVQDAS